MFSKLILFTAAALTAVVMASPFTPALVAVPDVHPTNLTDAGVPSIHEGTSHIPEIFGTTAANDVAHPLGRRANPSVCFCQTANCASACYCFSLVDRVPYTCYNAIGTYVSLYINDPNPGGLSYAVFVDGCPSTLYIPAVNTCYNSPAGTQWYIN
ncbi:hypothetical protein SISNIDRAFT_470285 [Sistotremastrum niveocremeum HHB9708]|uniref:Hydrophobin n=1 Tax=Sistotremastrum niveocremeum HHB9708 TaxID=1314777 RepID=A0A164P2C9_9AGAM|nr:hypothetical protein SISNIDRAFT_470285 [Sistotremastrum niveocremeum HHB9708]